jgi:aspartate/methionine/tyrosine aminotransferase
VVNRLQGIPGFGIDRVAAAAGQDPDVLRLENLDTDVSPHPGVIDATRAAIGRDEANSYLPFTGLDVMKEAVSELIERRGGPLYDPFSEVVVTQGDGDNMLDALLALTDPGDEVILTDPTYAGMIQRVRLVGAVPQFVPLVSADDGWSLDLDALRTAISERTRVLFIMSPSIPSGWVASEGEWAAIANLCREHGINLLYEMLWEAIVFGGRRIVVPSALEGMRDLTVTVGSVSHEQRLIGWRVGWMVGPAQLAPSLALTHIYNGVCTSGFCQIGAATALRLGDDDVSAAVYEWERRHVELTRQCPGRLVCTVRCGSRRPQCTRTLRSAARAEGRGDSHDRMGQYRSSPPCTHGVQQRACGTTGPLGRQAPPSARRVGRIFLTSTRAGHRETCPPALSSAYP